MEEKFDLPAPEERDIEMDIIYLTDRRDKTLASFNKKIKRNQYNREAITFAFESVLRVNKQVKMLQDAAKITEANKEK